MSIDVSYQIGACKRRMKIVRALIEEAKAKSQTATEQERQILLEAELLRMLEAQLAGLSISVGAMFEPEALSGICDRVDIGLANLGEILSDHLTSTLCHPRIERSATEAVAAPGHTPR